MNAIASPVPLHLLQELTVHLRKFGSKLTVAEAASAAIRSWIAREEQGGALPAQTPASPPASADAEVPASRGYQWKDLFLPEGTELRMSSAGQTYNARVVGDHIIYRGCKVSPRGLTLAIAGDGRNAWRDVWIRFSGQRHFLPASRCRREQYQQPLAPVAQAAAPVDSCADSLNAAVLTMAEVLKTTLALMERVKAHAMPEDERRIRPPRRELDMLGDDCAFD